MAERRMFAKSIIDSDAFLDMPITAQLLYFHLAMRADDDGFVNKPKSIMKQIGCRDDDIKILIGKKFVISFPDGIVVIKHWRIHNYIRKDTYNETNYKEDKALLALDENKAYTTTDGLRQLPVDGSSTQVRLGKDRLGKDKDTIIENFDKFVDAWNKLGLSKVQKLTDTRKRALRNRIKDFGEDGVLKAINLVKQSDFLMGRKKDWRATFDWLMEPRNMTKVIEGQYQDYGSGINNFPQTDMTDDLLDIEQMYLRKAAEKGAEL